MCIIGKVYANSMLVLINSRMVLNSEETQTPSTAISVLRFGAAPPNREDPAIEADNGDAKVEDQKQNPWQAQSLRGFELSVE